MAAAAREKRADGDEECPLTLRQDSLRELGGEQPPEPLAIECRPERTADDDITSYSLSMVPNSCTWPE